MTLREVISKNKRVEGLKDRFSRFDSDYPYMQGLIDSKKKYSKIRKEIVSKNKKENEINEGFARVVVEKELEVTKLIYEKILQLRKDLKSGVLPEDLFKEFKTYVDKVCDKIISGKY